MSLTDRLSGPGEFEHIAGAEFALDSGLRRNGGKTSLELAQAGVEAVAHPVSEEIEGHYHQENS